MQTNTPEIFIVTIPEGRAWSDCAIITPNDRLLADISKAYAPIEQHPIFQKWKLRPVSYIKGTVVVLAVLGGGHNYYHWMFEVLPRLSLLFASNISIDDIDYFFINNCKLSFQQETLAMLGIPMAKVIECNKKSHIKATKLIVPSLSGNTFDVPSWVCNFLRSKFLNSEIKRSAGDKRIYVSRTDAGYRKLLNEREVVDFLSRHRFEAVNLTSMSVAAQIELFAAAEVVVAPHGAGLANIVFCHPETKLVELFPPTYVKPYFWFLSNHIPLDYYCAIGEADPDTSFGKSHSYTHNFYIDIDKLSEIMAIADIH